MPTQRQTQKPIAIMTVRKTVTTKLVATLEFYRAPESTPPGAPEVPAERRESELPSRPGLVKAKVVNFPFKRVASR